MFGVSFSELILVGLVALLVLGPERLPGAARTAGLWIGRLKRSFNSIKQEIEREIGADEIRRQLHNEHILSLEQEARKILAPPASPATPAEPPAAAPAPAQHVPSPSEDAQHPHPSAVEHPVAHPATSATPKPPSPPEAP